MHNFTIFSQNVIYSTPIAYRRHQGNKQMTKLSMSLPLLAWHLSMKYALSSRAMVEIKEYVFLLHAQLGENIHIHE